MYHVILEFIIQDYYSFLNKYSALNSHTHLSNYVIKYYKHTDIFPQGNIFFSYLVLSKEQLYYLSIKKNKLVSKLHELFLFVQQLANINIIKSVKYI